VQRTQLIEVQPVLEVVLDDDDGGSLRQLVDEPEEIAAVQDDDVGPIRPDAGEDVPPERPAPGEQRLRGEAVDARSREGRRAAGVVPHAGPAALDRVDDLAFDTRAPHHLEQPARRGPRPAEGQVGVDDRGDDCSHVSGRRCARSSRRRTPSTCPAPRRGGRRGRGASPPRARAVARRTRGMPARSRSRQ